MKNLLFIPCYNDSKNCEKVLNEIYKLNNLNYDILIINDGSKNILKFKTKFLKIYIINLKNNFGIGHCMRLAINFAIKNNYENICRIDSDGEHNPMYLEIIFSTLKYKDFVIGQRNIFYKENFFKLFSKKILNFFINKLFKLKFKDYNCGMMGLNLQSMKILSKSTLINYPEPQIIIELCAKKLTHQTVNINQRRRYYGDSSLNFFKGLDFILVTFLYILNYIMNKK